MATERGHKGDGLPVALRHAADQPLAARATAAQPHHLGIGGSLVDEDQVGRIKHALFSHPALARSRHVRALLLRRVQAFFESDVVMLEEAPHRAAAARNLVPVHRQNRLVQGQVWPSRNQTQQKICMLLQRRDAPAPRLSRTAARLPKALDPDNRRAGTDIKLLGRRAPRRPAFNFRNHSRPHVFRIGLRHRPASQNRINADRLSHPSPSENLLDSIGTEHALVEVALDVIPGARRIGFLSNPRGASMRLFAQSVDVAARARGMAVLTEEAATGGELASAFARFGTQKVQAVIVPVNGLFFSEGMQIARLALAARLPTVAGDRQYVEAGLFASYGIDQRESYRRGASYVDRILKGAKAGDLPIEFPTRIELTINLKTAKALGLEIPPSLLARADEVIE